MAALRLILGFREFNSALDLVSEHNALLQSRGSVCWGWWRKNHEPEQVEALSELANSVPVEVRLVNREARRLFRGEICKVVVGSAQIDPGSVPEYYRHNIDYVAAWFMLAAPIVELPYDGELASQLGGQTFILYKQSDEGTLTPDKATIPAILVETEPTISPVIVHLSDIHFGPGDHNFLFPHESVTIGGPRFDLASVLRDDLRRALGDEAVGVLVMSGDITSKAYWEPAFRDKMVAAMHTITDYLGVSKDRVILGPGNHDFQRPSPEQRSNAETVSVDNAVNYMHEEHFRTFRNEFLGRNRRDPLSGCFTYPCGEFELRVGFLNSANLAATKFSEYGYVGSGPLEDVLRMMCRKEGPSLKILVLHHHLVPISPVQLPGQNGVSLTIDASEILLRAQQAGVQIVLHGHQHIPKVIKLSQAYNGTHGLQGLVGEDMFILSSGSAGSRELAPGMTNTYTLARVTTTGVAVSVRKINNANENLGTLFEAHLPIKPR